MNVAHALSYVPLAVMVGACLVMNVRRKTASADPAPLPGEQDQALSRDGGKWTGLAPEMERIAVPAEGADWQKWETELKEKSR